MSVKSSVTRGRCGALLLVVATVLTAAAGYRSVQPRYVPPVYAACGASFNCINDPTATSVLDVDHTYQAWTQPVEPNTGETWSITAYWYTDSTPPGLCQCALGNQANVNATVTWVDETGWSVSCTGCNAVYGPISGVSICNTGSCGGYDDVEHGYAYRLLVDIDHTQNWLCPLNMLNYYTYLTSVYYETTSVDSGHLVDVSVSP
jgi:hypothetical protein